LANFYKAEGFSHRQGKAMEMRMRTIIAACSVLLLLSASLRAEVLITANEAAQPPSSDASLNRRGVTRGPSVDQISPSPTGTVHSPLELKIKFTAHNGANVDPAAVKVLYDKEMPIDLTDRLSKYTSGDGIDMPDAEVPPGTHLLRVELKDSLGRKSVSEIKLRVQ
jgi:hypothetical protein